MGKSKAGGERAKKAKACRRYDMGEGHSLRKERRYKYSEKEEATVRKGVPTVKKSRLRPTRTQAPLFLAHLGRFGGRGVCFVWHYEISATRATAIFSRRYAIRETRWPRLRPVGVRFAAFVVRLGWTIRPSICQAQHGPVVVQVLPASWTIPRVRCARR